MMLGCASVREFAEADLLEEAARAAVEELGPHLLALQDRLDQRAGTHEDPAVEFGSTSRGPATLRSDY